MMPVGFTTLCCWPCKSQRPPVAADRKLTHGGHCADSKLTQVFYLLCPNFGQGTNKVITMEMLGRIRRMHLRDKVSLHEIAKRTGLARNTVRRWLRAPEEVQAPTYSRAAGFSKLGGFIAELEQSLKADALRPRARGSRARGSSLPFPSSTKSYCYK